MGIIRFLLACSVVIAHAHQSISLPILNAGACVETFFIISGFYMALVLETKYHSDRRAFWLNRWFRIAPTYYMILLASLAIYFAASLWKHHPIDRFNFFVTAFHDHAWGALALGTLPQISIVGLQWPLLQVYTPTSGLAWLGFSPMGETSIMMERFLFVNRLANAFVRLMFRHGLNDTTNAFKAYRRTVIEGVRPILSPHFNITVELPLKSIVRGYSYTTIPITWRNRRHGVAKLKINEMGSRYLFICLYVWLEKYFSRGDYKKSKS
jgi:hypothetical protein